MLELDAREKNRLTQSTIVAVVFWLILIGILAILPIMREIPEERTFHEVRLTLNQEVSVPAETTPVATTTARTTETDRSSAVPRTEDAAPLPKSKRTAIPVQEPISPTTKKTSSGLGIPDFNSTAGRETPSASGEYLSFSSDRPQEQATRDPGPIIREFEGSAARIDTPEIRPGNATVEGGTRPSPVSDETLQALDQIRASTGAAPHVPEGTSASATTPKVGSAVDRKGTNETATINTPGMVGPITFDGTARRLIYPVNPTIILPPHLARLIESDRSVTVSFTVRADGSVPVSLIRFTPAALLPPEVQNYLKNEFLTWRFERGTDNGQARFVYSIKVQ